MMFQSTRPRGARRQIFRRTSPMRLFQSTRPRGARRQIFRRTSPMRLFQSTRPRGARPVMQSGASGGRRFNPRAREGRDKARIRAAHAAAVSIHAPARGATGPKKPPILDNKFQSTRPRGARQSHHQPVSGGNCAEAVTPSRTGSLPACVGHKQGDLFSAKEDEPYLL